MSQSSNTVSNRFKLKVVFLGDQSTGKSSIIDRYINNTFRISQDPTVGVDFLGKNLSIKNRPFRLQLWDTAGQQRFRSLVPNYLRDAVCAILVFDLANQQSLTGLVKWMQIFEDHRNQHSVIVLCGNKKDLLPNFDKTKLQQFLRKYPMPFVETSALNGQGVNTLFQTVITQMLSKSNVINKASQQQQYCTTVKPLSITPSIPSPIFNCNMNQYSKKTKTGCC